MKLLMFYHQDENNLHVFPLPNKILDNLYFLNCSNWLLVSSSFCTTLKKTCLDQQTTLGRRYFADTQSQCLNRALFICLFNVVTFQTSPCSQTACVCHCVERLRHAHLTFLPWLHQQCCLALAHPNTPCGIVAC